MPSAALDAFEAELNKLNVGSSRRNQIMAIAVILETESVKAGVTQKADHDLAHLNAERATTTDPVRIARLQEAIDATNSTKVSYGVVSSSEFGTLVADGD